MTFFFPKSYSCAEEEKERLDMSWRLFVLIVLLVGYLQLLILPLEQGKKKK